MEFNNEKLKNYINGRSCSVLGLGVSNLPTAQMLSSFGIELTVADKKTPEELGASALALRDSGVRFISGNNCFDSIDTEVVIRSPGIRPDIPGITTAVQNGAELTSEIELLLTLTDAETFAITGSDGKTTSTTLTGKFLEAEAKKCGGRVYVGGNIGTPLLPLCSEMTDKDSAVLELSSFQLMTVSKAPKYCAITNLSPNHLDWHKSGLDEYETTKRNIIGNETVRIVLNAESEPTLRIAHEEIAAKKREVFVFSSKRGKEELLEEFKADNTDKKLKLVYESDGYLTIFDGEKENRILKTDGILLVGRHNLENYMTAIALTYGRISQDIYTDIARTFGGVEHRLQLVRSLRGVDYYNSSIDSSPSRTRAALSALHGRDIVIICGGYDKKIPFEPLAEALCKSVRIAVLTGATAELIRKTTESHKDFESSHLTLVSEPDFEAAVRRAHSLAKTGGCVLLSPACASFDVFNNFAERGNRFCEIVATLE